MNSGSEEIEDALVYIHIGLYLLTALCSLCHFSSCVFALTGHGEHIGSLPAKQVENVAAGFGVCQKLTGYSSAEESFQVLRIRQTSITFTIQQIP